MDFGHKFILAKYFLIRLFNLPQIIAPANAFFFDIVNSIANTVLDGVNGAVDQIFNTLSPSQPDNDVDNTASRLLKTISSASPGVLRQSAIELNTAASPEVEISRQTVLDNLKVTESTPQNLRKLSELLETFVDNVPRSTLDSSGLLPAVPQVIKSLEELDPAFNGTTLTPMIVYLEDMAINLVANFIHMRTLTNLPTRLTHLPDRLMDDREKIVFVGQVLIQVNETHVAVISDLLSSVDVIVNSVSVIFNAIQNVISKTRLNFENHASSVIAQIQDLTRSQLKELPGLIKEATKSLPLLADTIDKDMTEALNFNDIAVAEATELSSRLNGIAGNSMDLLNRQIQSSLTAIHKSTSPTVAIIVSQLKSLAEATESVISNSVTTSSNNLYTSFDGTMATVEMHLIKGALNPQMCVNETLMAVQEISETAVQSLSNCALVNAEDTKKFINKMLDDTDDLLLAISTLADQLDVCSGLADAENSLVQSSLAFRMSSCLQSVSTNIRQSVVLNQLANIQVATTRKINLLHTTIHTCVYQALYDADNGAVTLDKATQLCFRKA